MGSSLSPQAVFAVVAAYGRRLQLRIKPHDLRRYAVYGVMPSLRSER